MSVRLVCPCTKCTFANLSRRVKPTLHFKTVYKHLRVTEAVNDHHFPCPCSKCNSVFQLTVADIAKHLYLEQHPLPEYVDYSQDLVPLAEGFQPEYDISDDLLSDDASDDEHDLAVRQFSRLLIESIGNGRATVTGADTFLLILKETLYKYLPWEISMQLPVGMYQLSKMARVVSPASFRLHFCSKGHYTFDPLDPSEVYCPKCDDNTRYDGRRRPNLVVTYYELRDWIRTVLTIPELRRYLIQWKQNLGKGGRGQFKSCYDGSILNQEFLFAGAADDAVVLPFAQCHDGTVVRENSKLSMIPVLFQCLAFPEHIRKTFGALYLAAVVPHEVSDMQRILRPVVLQFRALAPTIGSMVMQLPTRGEIVFHAVIAWMVNDLKGIASALMAKGGASYVGTCLQCEQQGIRVDCIDTMIFPGI
jgi:hypothetical protein